MLSSTTTRWLAIILLVTTSVLAAPHAALAIYQTDRAEIQTTLYTQSTFQHNGAFDHLQWVQQRVQIELQLKYHLIPPRQTFGILKTAQLALDWRGRYDPVFQIRESYRERNYDRKDFIFPEGDRPYEAYLDLGFTGALSDLSMRIGKQQVVWGEADFFRSLDVINPLRVDQMGLVGDDLDKYREPLWIAKFLYSFGSLIPGVGELNLETFYSPDGRPLTNKLVLGDGFRIYEDLSCFPEPVDCRRPHRLPFRRIRHPWEVSRVGPDHHEAPDQGDLGPLCASLGIPTSATNCKADFMYLVRPRYGDGADYMGMSEVDLSRSMAGVRLLGQTATGGIYFTLNYIWKRAEILAPYIGWETLFDPTILPDTGLANVRADKAMEAMAALASPDANGDGIPDGNEALLRDSLENENTHLILGPVATGGRTAYGYEFPRTSVGQAGVPVKGWFPYSHIIGVTATYNDFDYTGFIWRTEQSYSLKEPRMRFPALVGTRAGDFPRQSDFHRGGKETTSIWRSMVGFDYLRAPFSHYMLPTWMKQQRIVRSLLTDQWFFTFQFFNEYWSNVSGQLGQDFSVTNRHQHWNPILTWIMTGFFLNQRFRPTIALAYDVNAEFPVTWLQGQFELGQHLQLRLGEVLYMGSTHAESFLLLNHFANYNVTYARLTYHFL